jgi:hypothetical protein
MKKNNLFKISLLLLVSNLSSNPPGGEHPVPDYIMKRAALSKDDPEVKACREGVAFRAKSSSVPLLTNFEEIQSVTGKKPHPSVDTLQEKAAWIFGYNQNMTGPPIREDRLSYTFHNGNDIGVMFNPPAPVEFGAVDGWGDNKRAWLDHIEVCDYGKKIGWAFDAPKSSATGKLNFFKTSGAYSENDMIGKHNLVFGETFDTIQKYGAYGRRNMLQNILNSFNKNNSYAPSTNTGFKDSGPLTRNADGKLQ